MAAKEKRNPQASVYRRGLILGDLGGDDFVSGVDWGGFEVLGRQAGVVFGGFQLVVAEQPLEVADYWLRASADARRRTST